MRKFNFLKFAAVVLLSGVVVFSACKKDEDDTEKPVITLKGNTTDAVSWAKTGSYTDPGATASDNEDGDISSSIIVSGSVDLTKAGEYTLKYNVTDKAGNAADEVKRTVKVDAGKYLVITGQVNSYQAVGSDGGVADNYTDTIVYVGENRLRFTRLTNRRNCNAEFTVSGDQITIASQNITCGSDNLTRTFVSTSGSISKTAAGTVFMVAGTYTFGTGAPASFTYTFTKQ